MAKRHANLETATHVAGCWVKIANRAIQRCCVCGEKLADSADPNMQMLWGEGEMVRADNGELEQAGELLNIKKVPKDFCLALVEI